MSGYLSDLNDIMTQWVEDVVNKIRQNLDSTGTTASGKTKESIEYTVENGELVITGRPYFRGVEIGRPGGRVPYNFTDIIQQWAKDKGIITQFGSTEAEQRNVSARIAWFIREKGTKLFRNGGREDIYTSVINEELPKLQEKIWLTVRDTIVNNLNI